MTKTLWVSFLFLIGCLGFWVCSFSEKLLLFKKEFFLLEKERPPYDQTSSNSLQNFFIKIPIHYLSFLKEPHIEVEIEKKKYYFLMDSGSDTQLSFQSKNIHKIQNKNFLGILAHCNFKGTKQTSSVYQLEKIKIGENLVLFNTNICTDHDEALRKANNLNQEANLSSWIWGKIDSWFSHGKVGNGIFKNFVCHFDLPHKTFCIAKDLETLIQEGQYSLDSFIHTSIEIASFGPLIKIETPWGPKTFLLDTGSTRSLIRRMSPDSEKEIKTELFLDNRYLGTYCLVSCSISPQFANIDGILGVDFFQEHVICIDYLNKAAYIYRNNLKQ